MDKYLANKNTKEIHKLSNEKTECKLSEIKEEHKIYLQDESQVDNLIKNNDYDGCYHCYKEKHTK